MQNRLPTSVWANESGADPRSADVGSPPLAGGRKLTGSLRAAQRSFDHAKLVEVVRQARSDLVMLQCSY